MTNPIINPYITPATTPQEQWRHFFQQPSHQPIPATTQTAVPRVQVANAERYIEIPALTNRGLANDTHGDNLYASQDFTVRSQNINGLSTSTIRMTDWNLSHEHSTQRKVDIDGHSETNTEWNNRQFRYEYLQSIKKFDRHAQLLTSTTTTVLPTLYKPGGTSTTVWGRYSGSVAERLHDTSGLGRFTGVYLHRKHDKKLLIIQAYRPAQKEIGSAGPLSAYYQQYTIMAARGTSHPKPRDRIILDLIKIIKKAHSDETEVILMMDANETMGEDTIGISTLCGECGLIDAIEYKHGTFDNLTTYEHGSRQIDYIFVTESIASAITTCGILPFKEGHLSDHRALHVSFDHKMLFKGEYVQRPEQQRRGIHSGRPKAVVKYKKLLHHFLHHHNVFNNMNTLQPRSQPPEIWTELETIDNQCVEGALNAAEKVDNKVSGPWSLAIHHAALIINYWRLKQTHRRKPRDLSNVLQAIKEQIPEALHPKLTQVKSSTAHIREARAAIVKMKPEGDKLRDETLQEWAHAAAVHNMTTKIGELKQIKTREKKRKCHQKLARIFHKSRSNGIQRLHVPDVTHVPTDEVPIKWKVIHDAKEMNQCLYDRTSKHFLQANGSPFTVAPITTIFGETGTNDNAEKVYAGIFEIPDYALPEESEAIIKQIMKHKLPEFDSEVTIDEVKLAFKNWKETTATSPSGRHLGHYKALFAPDGIDHSAEEETQGDQIMSIYVKLLNLAIQSSYSMHRWHTVISAMIEKIPGTPRIDKLRIIHLYEADYNLFCRIMWARRMMTNAENRKFIAKSQFGGRKGHKPMDMVLKQQLNVEYSRMTRTPLATLDQDFASCYDRMTVTLSALLSRNHGVPRNACHVLADSLRQMKFFIRTANGKMDKYYTTTDDVKVQGAGQGNSAAGPLWTIHFSIINACYEAVATGMITSDPTQEITITEYIDGFVDDTYMFSNCIENLRQSITDNATLWERLLYTSGGKLEMSKCFFYQMEWCFSSEGKARIKTLDEVGREPIMIRDSNTGILHPIKPRACETAHKTLGCWKTLEGNQSQQKDVLMEKSRELGNKIAGGGVYRYEAKVAYNSNYLSSMTYPLSASYFHETELDSIQAKADRHFYPAMGYSSKFPKAVARASEEVGGVDLHGVYGEQGTISMKQVIQHIRTGSSIADDLRVHLHWAQHLAGVSKPILMHTRTIPHLEETLWLNEMRNFMHKINASINIPDLWNPGTERVHDSHLMDEAMNFTNKQRYLEKINRCRFFLKATTISDITQLNGKVLQKSAWGPTAKEEYHTSASRSTLTWPVQPCPGYGHWMIWRRFLRCQYIKPKSLQLRQKLNEWTLPMSRQRNRWPDYTEPTANKLYRYDEEAKTYHIHHVLRTQESNTIFQRIPNGSTNNPPPLSLPTTVTTIGRNLCAKRTSNHNDTSAEHNTPESGTTTNTSWETYVQSLPRYVRELIQDASEMNEWSDSNMKDTIYVSDGSAKITIGTGSYGWISSVSKEYDSTSQGIAGGNHKMLSSYRTEGIGALSYHLYVLHKLLFHNITKEQATPIQCYCDNLGLVLTIKRFDEIIILQPKDTTITDYDVIAQIADTRRQLKERGVTFDIHHVLGHQDDDTPFHKLPHEAQLNVKANDIAEVAIEHLIRDDSLSAYNEFPATKCHLYIDDLPITGDIPKAIRNAFSDKAYFKYITKKFRWDLSTTELLWIKPIKPAIQKFTPNDRVRINKMRCNWLPTAKRRNYEKSHLPKECRLCPTVTENQDHIFRCRNPLRRTKVLEALARMRNELNNHQTPDIILQVIHDGVRGWIELGHRKLLTPENIHPDLIEAIRQQNLIGWNKFILGFLAKGWESAINQLSPATEKQKSSADFATIWAPRCIHATLTFCIDVWKTRNEQHVGGTPEEQENRLAATLQTEVSMMYEQLGDLPTTLQYLKRETLEWWKQTNSTTKQTWLIQVTPILHKLKKDRLDQRLSGHQDLRDFFAPV
jgi:hypothetical protein